jgi:uncharacterized protein YdeI (YjbR/CyaY-like superfamily)
MREPKNPLSFANSDEWRAWLAEHHATDQEARVIQYKKAAGPRGLTYEAALNEALCFGWIDGLAKSLDAEKFALRYSPRKPGSIWSESNKRRVRQLTRAGRMAPAGLAEVAKAKKSGQWQAAAEREQVDVIPADLAKALRRQPGCLAAYRGLTASLKKQYLGLLGDAKRPETRAKRVERIVGEVLSKRRVR